MLLSILSLCVIIAITTFLVLKVKSCFKSEENAFWKLLLAMYAAICLPITIFQIIYLIIVYNSALTPNLTMVLNTNFVASLAIPAILFIVYLIFWKLKNRKFILLLCTICFLTAIIELNAILGIIPNIIVNTIKNEPVFEYLEKYKAVNGVYPQDIKNIKTKYSTNYKTFNNGSDFAIHFGINRPVWTYCTSDTENDENCHLEKWLFNKDGQTQWIAIPEKDRYRIKQYKKIGDFTNYVFQN